MVTIRDSNIIPATLTLTPIQTPALQSGKPTEKNKNKHKNISDHLMNPAKTYVQIPKG